VRTVAALAATNLAGSYNVNGWSRCFIPKDQNEGGGRNLGAFLNDQRLLDVNNGACSSTKPANLYLPTPRPTCDRYQVGF
jgi:hypothetical protein